MAVKKSKWILPDANRIPSVEEVQRIYDSGGMGEINNYYTPPTPEEIESSKRIGEFVGKNEIIFHEGDDGQYVYKGKVNGAVVRVEDGVELNYNYTGKGGYITLNEGIYLTQIFKNLPFGILKKNRTGVGATTLEINADRDSIIVMPTKNLAYEKAVANNCLYVGSEIEGQEHKMPSIEDYLADETIKPKKIIVVADSLGKVIRAML